MGSLIECYMKEDIGKGLEGSSRYLNAVLFAWRNWGEKHKRPQSRQLVSQQRLELGTVYGITVRSACLFKTLHRGILNGVTL